MKLKTAIKVAICDDEKEMLDQLKMMLETLMSEKNVPCQIHCFLSGMDLLAGADIFDLVFLDIEMPEVDGIETGLALRRKNPKCKIIMASGMVERMKEGYKLQALRFITKPYEMPELEEAVTEYCNRLIGMEEVAVYKDRQMYSFKQRDIAYLASVDSYIEISVNGILYRKKTSLRIMERELDERCFFRIHNQYIVNLYYVNDYKKGIVFLKEKELPVSRKNQTAFEKAYREFDLYYR